MADKQTYAGTGIFICSTPQSNDLNAAGFAALVWLEINDCAKSGDWGDQDNGVEYPVLKSQVAAQQKGLKRGGIPTLNVAVDKTDAGQNALRTASATKNNYAFKRVLPNAEIQYNRGVVMAPRRNDEGPDSFVEEIFEVRFNQALVIV